MNLKDYLKTKEFVGKVEGLPEGDTFITINEVKADDFSFQDDNGKTIVKTKLIFPDGAVRYCPDSVLKQIEELAGKGFERVRVTRTGTSFDKTRYAVVGVVTAGQ